MINEEYKVIGVMSGTSLDGIDIAYLQFNKNEGWQFKILIAETIPYSQNWLSILKHLTHFKREKLNEIDQNYTDYLSEIIQQFINKHHIKQIDAVCSHGHTALHQPENKLTYQIGNLQALSTKLNTTVVCDFRTQDVLLGGQGAPLVPIGDELLFSNYDFCINLGGFANVSTKVNNQRIAFDICPVNIVLNKYVSTLGLDYDNKGVLASEGKLNNQLLNQLNKLPFYKKSYPKSLGLEWVDQDVFPIINSFKLSTKDILRTFVEHIAIQISKVINSKSNATVLITGGGVYHTFLVEKIKALTNNKIIIPSKEIIEFKEALIFGFLGVLKLRGENNCLASVTGASKDHSSGKVFKV